MPPVSGPRLRRLTKGDPPGRPYGLTKGDPAGRPYGRPVVPVSAPRLRRLSRPTILVSRIPEVQVGSKRAAPEPTNPAPPQP